MTDPGRRDFLKQATMALVAMGLPADAIDLREPKFLAEGFTRVTWLDMDIGKGGHQVVYRVVNRGPQRVRLKNLMPGFTYLIIVETQAGAVSDWDWDRGMLWPQRSELHEDGRRESFIDNPTLSTEPGSFDVIYAVCVASDRVICSYSTGHR